MPTIRLVPSQIYNGASNYVSISNASNAYYDTDHTSSYATIQNTNSSTSSRYVYVRGFNFSSIPSGAVISSFSVKVRGYETGLATSTSYAPTLANGTTALSNTTASSNFGTSTKVITVPNGAVTWDNITSYGSNFGIRLNVRRNSRNTAAYIYLQGAEIEVTYTIPVYHNVTVTNSTSATVTANPSTVSEGESSTIIADTISGITITDNNVDVTNQFVQHSGTTGEYLTETRGSYGFTVNSNGYYQSDNKGVDKSCAVCRISFDLPVSATITFQYINYAEATYDFGVFGNVDVALTTSYYPAGSGGATISETSYKKACNTSSDNTSSVQTLTYSNVSAGSHFIDVKYSKDDASAANNDTLQFKVTITYSQSVTYYSYTISNITADHAIVVTQSSGGPKIFIKENGSWAQYSKVYLKVNGSWVEQSSSTWSTLFSTTANYVHG